MERKIGLIVLGFALAVIGASSNASEFPINVSCTSFGLEPAQSGSLTIEEDFAKWEVRSKVPNPSEDTCSMEIQSNASIILGRSYLPTKLSGWVLVKGTTCNLTKASDLTHRWNNRKNLFAGKGIDSISGANMYISVVLESGKLYSLEVLPDIDGIKSGDSVGCTYKAMQ